MSLSGFMACSESRRAHSQTELIADGAVHMFGLGIGVAGAVALLAVTAGRSDGFKLAGALIYALGLLAMLACSAAYNLGYNTGWRGFFRRCDHCAIFLMIAGTYTPFILHLFSGVFAATLGAAVWSAALTGIYLKLAKPPLFERLSVGLYLLLGWFSVIILAPFAGQMSGMTMTMLVSGGVLYTAGVVFHMWERLPFQNAIWHVFVLAAAICHYWAVMDGVVLAGA